MSAKDDLLYAVMHANTERKGDFTGEEYRDELKENAAKEPSAGGSGGGGSYVVRLPADTVVSPNGDGNMIVMATESRDNFAEILYNGGTVQIYMGDHPLAAQFGLIMVVPSAWAYNVDVIGTTALIGFATLYLSGQITAFVFRFENGTWRPPTA